MTPLDEVTEKVRELSLEDLTLLMPVVQEELRKKAAAQLATKEEEVNELRELAGMKRRPKPYGRRKPEQKQEPEQAPEQRRRGPGRPRKARASEATV